MVQLKCQIQAFNSLTKKQLQTGNFPQTNPPPRSTDQSTFQYQHHNQYPTRYSPNQIPREPHPTPNIPPCTLYFM